jgi:hypothetical protein
MVVKCNYQKKKEKKKHTKLNQTNHNYICIVPNWDYNQSISSGAQYETLQNYFSHPSLVMYSFATPPIKLG